MAKTKLCTLKKHHLSPNVKWHRDEIVIKWLQKKLDDDGFGFEPLNINGDKFVKQMAHLCGMVNNSVWREYYNSQIRPIVITEFHKHLEEKQMWLNCKLIDYNREVQLLEQMTHEQEIINKTAYINQRKADIDGDFQ